MYSKYIRVFFFFNILLLILTVASNAYFIPRMGIEGAALATMLSVFVINTGRSLFIYFKFGFVPLKWKDSSVFLLIGAILFIMTQVMPVLDSLWIDLIVRTVLVVLLYLPVVYFLKVSEDFNTMIKGVINYVRSING